MRLLIAIATLTISALPVLSLDLTDQSYIGLDMSAIKSNYSCAPPFLILGGDHRLVCNDNGNRTLVFILTNKKAVRVDITPQDPPLILNETISSLQSQCEPGEDNVTFKCKMVSRRR